MKHVKKFEGVFDGLPEDYTVEDTVRYLEESWNLDSDEFVIEDNHIKDVFWTEITMPPNGVKKLSICLSITETIVIVTMYINDTVYEQDRFEGASTLAELFDTQIDNLLKSYNADFDYVQVLNQQNIKMEAEIEDNTSSITERIAGIKGDRNLDQYRKKPRYPTRVV